MPDEKMAQQPVVINLTLTFGDLFEGLLKRKKAKAEKPKEDDDDDNWVKIDGPTPYPG